MEADEPRKKIRHEVGQPLDSLSVEELRDYRLALENEVSRVGREIEKRADVKSAAEALFKKPSS